MTEGIDGDFRTIIASIVDAEIEENANEVCLKDFLMERALM